MTKKISIFFLLAAHTFTQGADQPPPNYRQSEIQNAVDTLAALMQGPIEPPLTNDQLHGLMQLYTETITHNRAVNQPTTNNVSLLVLARSNNQFHTILSQLQTHQNDR
jgi:hypothetical protein